MSKWPKEAIINGIVNDISDIHVGGEGIIKWTDETYAETIEFVRNLIDQIPNAISNPLIPKTPKVPRKKDIKRIETIPEDDSTQNVSKGSITLTERSKMEATIDTQPPVRKRGRRAASQKAVEHMKIQQSLDMLEKLRRPSNEEDRARKRKPQRVSRTKRIKSIAISSDEEETERPKKYTKIKEKSMEKSSVTSIIPKKEREVSFERPSSPSNKTYTRSSSANNETFARPLSSRNKTIVNSSTGKLRNKRTHQNSAGRVETREIRRSTDASEEPLAKRANIIDETMDVTVEPSLYEDAVGKSIPMNSTMNPNCTGTFDRKMMNLTIVLESMPLTRKMNETVTLAKRANNPSSGRNTLVKEEPSNSVIGADGSPSIIKTVTRSKSSLQNKMKALKETLANKEFDALITEDESSPEEEEKLKRKKRNKPQLTEAKRVTRSSLSTEDDDNEAVTPTPGKKALRSGNNLKNMKHSYKPNALFSPYAKDSVKKRVEAFEQAGLQSPKAVDVDVPARQTRTKTRAMAAAESTAVLTPNVQTIAQKLARKSLAKAKKISLQRQMKESEEGKENNITNSAQKVSRLLGLNEKIAQKQQQRTTPVVKSRLQTPMSVNRIQHTPASSHVLNQQNKALTTARANIVTSVDTFLPPAKTLTKSNSTDNLVDKRRKMNDEDAKRKKDDALKALCDEKRRKREEKELKNKLAREAKEKLDMEKRLKQEREREEKARVALLLQDKQREEFEKKRLLQLQRAQEKEERRKLEEQLRLQRLQEQEETERQLAEQKRREQDAERRKLAEARAQQAAANEAAKLKCQILAKKLAATKQHEQQQDPTSYKLDSEPDDDESDDESAPKHTIPHWAQPSVRSVQLAIQQHIPMAPVLQFFGTRRCTPDLTELFKGIKKERLERTSSAIWKTPPRYSMMTGE